MQGYLPIGRHRRVNSKARILETATRLFAQQGFAGVSLQSIAERVGMSKPSLLYHFPSKDKLREGVLADVFEHWTTRLPSLLRAVTSGPGQFHALMEELVSFFTEDRDRAHLLLRELLDRPVEMKARISSSLKPLVTLVAEAIRKGQSAKVLRAEVDPEAFVLHMIALTIAMVVALPAIEPIAGEDEPRALARQEHELQRIAFTSLFSAPDGATRTPHTRKPSPTQER